MKKYLVEITDLDDDYGVSPTHYLDIMADSSVHARKRIAAQLKKQGLIEGKNYKIESATIDKRYVYGTRDEKWHLVDSDDRDWKTGITPLEMKRLGKKGAKAKYLSPSFF